MDCVPQSQDKIESLEIVASLVQEVTDEKVSQSQQEEEIAFVVHHNEKNASRDSTMCTPDDLRFELPTKEPSIIADYDSKADDDDYNCDVKSNSVV